MTQNDLHELLVNRRSIEQFDPTQAVSVQTVRQAVEAARWAPNHKLTEPWRFYLAGPETRAKLLELLQELFIDPDQPEKGEKKLEKWRNMSALVLQTSRLTPQDDHRTREDFAASCCAFQNFALSLWQAGVGIKWSTGKPAQHPTAWEAFGADPQQEQLVGLYGLGVPAKIPRTRRSKSVEEILIERP